MVKVVDGYLLGTTLAVQTAPWHIKEWCMLSKKFRAEVTLSNMSMKAHSATLTVRVSWIVCLL